jgi:hypothetical protein
MVQKHRETILQIVPRWLRNGDAARVLYTVGLHADALADWVTMAVRSRFPGAPNTAPDALPTIGRDRKILRNTTGLVASGLESDKQFAWRLQDWFAHHKTRGNAYAFLSALHAYLQGFTTVTAAAGANILGAGTLTINTPAYEEGTWWILQVMQDSGAAHTAPAGWERLRTQTLASGAQHFVYGRAAAAGIASVGLAVTGSGTRVIGRIYRLNGQFDPARIADQIVVREANLGSGTGVAGITQTSTVRRLALVAYDSGGSITPALIGVSEVAAEAVAGGAADGVGISAQTVSTIIAGGADTATLSNTAAWGCVVLELEPSAGTSERAELIYRNGLRYSMAASGAVTRDHVTWLGSPHVAKNGWASWWLVIHRTDAVLSDFNWDDPGTYDDGGLWDTGLTVAEYADYKIVPNAENAGHAIGYLVLLPPGAEIADYAAHPDAPIWENPDACSTEGIVLLPLTPGASL